MVGVETDPGTGAEVDPGVEGGMIIMIVVLMTIKKVYFLSYGRKARGGYVCSC